MEDDKPGSAEDVSDDRKQPRSKSYGGSRKLATKPLVDPNPPATADETLLPAAAPPPFNIPSKPKTPSPKVSTPVLLAKSVQMYFTKLPLAKGGKTIERSTSTDLKWMTKTGIEKLIAIGAVRKVLSPPLDSLAGWQTRAKRLKPTGVVTMADFLAVPVPALAEFLRVKPDTVKEWQSQLQVWSESEKPPQR